MDITWHKKSWIKKCSGNKKYRKKENQDNFYKKINKNHINLLKNYHKNLQHKYSNNFQNVNRNFKNKTNNFILKYTLYKKSHIFHKIMILTNRKILKDKSFYKKSLRENKNRTIYKKNNAKNATNKKNIQKYKQHIFFKINHRNNQKDILINRHFRSRNKKRDRHINHLIQQNLNHRLYKKKCFHKKNNFLSKANISNKLL